MADFFDPSIEEQIHRKFNLEVASALIRLAKAIAVFSVAILCFDLSLVAQNMSPAAVVAQAATRLNGKVFRLRHLVAQSTVKYDDAGQLLGHQEPGDWTLHSQLEITDIRYKDETLFVTGNRVVISFEGGNGVPRFLPTSKTAEIRIKTSKTASFDIEKELHKAFLATTEKFPENLAAYWDNI